MMLAPLTLITMKLVQMSAHETAISQCTANQLLSARVDSFLDKRSGTFRLDVTHQLSVRLH